MVGQRMGEKPVGRTLFTQYVNDLSSLGSILTTPGLPRTYGVDFSLRF